MPTASARCAPLTPESGRLTDINTTKGSIVLQNNDYAWRSNSTLESRIAYPSSGLSTTRKELYAYDVLNRVTVAETIINVTNTRDLAYSFSQLGNLTSKTSTLPGDTDVTSYAYGAGNAGPNAVTSATVNGVGHTLTYDNNGAITRYDIAGTSDDKWIAYNALNQPTKIVVGTGLGDTAPVARDEFAYDPNGQRYARKSSWQAGSTTVTEEVAYIGAVEIISDNETTGLQTITKTRLSPDVMHVKIQGSTTAEVFEYAHRDHLGSIEVVTDDNGNILDRLAFEPFGSRKKKDWGGNISTTELDSLLGLDWDHSRKARGFTGHEHLDRTGFVHMNGRVYDPILGRFLSPDPVVAFPTFSQSWDRYSYVVNSPVSLTDPSGFAPIRVPNAHCDDGYCEGFWLRFHSEGECWFDNQAGQHCYPGESLGFDRDSNRAAVDTDLYRNEISQTDADGPSNTNLDSNAPRAAVFVRSSDPATVVVGVDTLHFDGSRPGIWLRIDVAPGVHPFTVTAGPGGHLPTGTVLRNGTVDVRAWDIVEVDVNNNFVTSVFNDIKGKDAFAPIKVTSEEPFTFDVKIGPITIFRGTYSPEFGTRAQ